MAAWAALRAAISWLLVGWMLDAPLEAACGAESTRTFVPRLGCALRDPARWKDSFWSFSDTLRPNLRFWAPVCRFLRVRALQRVHTEFRLASRFARQHRGLRPRGSPFGAADLPGRGVWCTP